MNDPGFSPNFFELAQEYYQKNPPERINSKRLKLAIKELILVIETAPFLTTSQKESMIWLVPIYSLSVIEKVKKNLIEQGLLYLNNNPQSLTSVEQWLNTSRLNSN